MKRMRQTVWMLALGSLMSCYTPTANAQAPQKEQRNKVEMQQRRPHRPPHRPVDRYMPMSREDFEFLYNKVEKKPFKEDKMDLVEVGIRSRRLTCNQCARLMSLFTWDDDKMKILDMADDSLVDRENSGLIIKAFDSLFKQDEVRQRLGIREER